MTKPQLRTLINKIRNETKNKGNTRGRVADTLDSIVTFIDSKFIKNDKESLTQLGTPTLVGNVATIRYTNETGLEQTVSLDLSTIVTKDTHITEVSYDTSTNTLSLKDNEGKVYQEDLGELSVYSTTNPEGVTTLTQEGIVKATLSKVGQSGQYADLLEVPDLSIYATADALNTEVARNNAQDTAIAGKINNPITPATTSQVLSWDGSPVWKNDLAITALQRPSNDGIWMVEKRGDTFSYSPAPDPITSSIENDSSVPGETLNETLEYLHSEVNTPQHDTIVSTEPPTGIANEGTEWIIYK